MLVFEESTALPEFHPPLNSSSSSIDLLAEGSELGARAGALGWRWSLDLNSSPMVCPGCGTRSEPRRLTQPTK
jgi:hypothetical protein